MIGRTGSAAVVVAHSGSYDGINEGLPAVLQVFTPAGARILRFARGSVPPGAAFYRTPSGFGVRFADMAVRGNRVVVVGSGSLAGRGVFETAPWIELLDIP